MPRPALTADIKPFERFSPARVEAMVKGMRWEWQFIRQRYVLLYLGTLMVALLAATQARADRASFGDWAVAVVAGDWRGSDGGPSPVFDNARRDISAALARAGFAPGNIRQFSTAALDAGVLRADATNLADTWFDLTRKASGGCLIYLTSHGNRDGIILGRRAMMAPGELDTLLDLSCGDRPTVVIVSACYSGVFVPAVAGTNRMVLTAARPDRSSFGCGNDTTYPYFDGCLIEALPKSANFPALAATARACVARREKAAGLAPPSEPQLSIGETLRTALPRLSLHPD